MRWSRLTRFVVALALDVNIVKLDDGTPAANYKIAEYPSSHAAFSNKDVCIKAIRMERKLELAMEGERWFDLSRWGGDVMASELKAYVDYEKQYISKFAGASYLSSKKTMLPFPDDEILTLGTDPENRYSVLGTAGSLEKLKVYGDKEGWVLPYRFYFEWCLQILAL